MASIILIVLQIMYLLLRAHFDKSDTQEVALNNVREAQKKLDVVATEFERRIRYGSPTPSEVDHVEELMDKARPSAGGEK